MSCTVYSCKKTGCFAPGCTLNNITIVLFVFSADDRKFKPPAPRVVVDSAWNREKYPASKIILLSLGVFVPLWLLDYIR